jgi:PIN domain nuclease of toxin-antitoxin system
MKILLDTHTFMWWDNEPEKIPKASFDLICDPSNELFLSLVSIWEMQIKIQLGKLKLKADLESIVDSQQVENDIKLLDIKVSHILELSNLPNHHKDPFDRLLIAQSKIEKVSLVSCDAIFKQYECSVIW